MGKSLKIRLVIIFFALMAASVVAALFGSGVFFGKSVSAQEPTVNVEVEPKISAGETLSVKSALITFGDQTKEAKFYTISPFGEKIEEISFFASEYGVYTIVYYAEFDGEIQSVEIPVTVEMPLFTMGKETDVITYEAPSLFDKENREGETEKLYGAYLRMSESYPATLNEVIDFSELSVDDPLMEFYIVPSRPGVETKPTYRYSQADGYNLNYTLGTPDFSKITFMLTDCYDSANYVKIDFIDADQWFFYVMTASRENQLSGWDYGNPVRLMTNGRFGTGIRLSSSNVHYSSDPTGKDWTTCYTRLYFDYAEKQLFVETKGTTKCMVLDYDDSTNVSELWEGFSEGKARLTVECSRLTGGAPASLLFTKINGKRVDSVKTGDSVDPELKVDTNEYYGKDLPLALVGKEYKIFSYSASDSNGNVFSEVKVVDGDGKEYLIKDDAFVPDKAGVYYLTYSVNDPYLNTVRKTFEITAVNSLETIKIGVKSGYTVSAKQGEYIKVAEFAESGGSGKIKTANYVLREDDSAVIEIKNGEFFADKAGTYSVQYVLTDYLGQKYCYHYEITVEPNDGPFFRENAELPRFFLLGKKVVLPKLSAYVAENDGQKAIGTEITVSDGNGTRKLNGNVYEIPNLNTEKITVSYKAEYKGKTAEKTYEIPTAKVLNDNGAVNSAGYFAVHGLNTSVVKDGVSFATDGTTGNKIVEFVNAILTDGAELKFNVPDKSRFSALNIYLTDCKDETRVLKFSYDVTDKSRTKFSVNDGVPYVLKSNLAYGNVFALTLNDITGVAQTGGDTTAKIKNWYKGGAYDGFIGRTAYLTFELENSTENAVFNVNSVNGQMFSERIKIDAIVPAVSVLGARCSIVDPGETVVIPKAIAVDVLDSYTELSVSVYKVFNDNGNETKEYLYSDDGVLLNGVSAERSYAISDLPTGQYYYAYEAFDSVVEWAANVVYALEIADLSAPVITLKNLPKDKMKTGDKITLPEVSVIDDKDGNIEVYYLYVITPKGIYEPVLGNSYTFAQAGVYRFMWTAFDGAGNMGKTEYVVKVI